MNAMKVSFQVQFMWQSHQKRSEFSISEIIILIISHADNEFKWKCLKACMMQVCHVTFEGRKSVISLQFLLSSNTISFLMHA